MKKLLIVVLFIFQIIGAQEDQSAKNIKSSSMKISKEQLVQASKAVVGGLILTGALYSLIPDILSILIFHTKNILYRLNFSILSLKLSRLDSNNEEIIAACGGYALLQDGIKQLRKLRTKDYKIQKISSSIYKKNRSNCTNKIHQVKRALFPFINIAIAFHIFSRAGTDLLKDFSKPLFSEFIVQNFVANPLEMYYGYYFMDRGIKKLVKQYSKKKFNKNDNEITSALDTASTQFTA